MYCVIVMFQILNNIGNNNVNSMSQRIKNIHNITKFILICIFTSDNDLKPHSQKCLLLFWFFILQKQLLNNSNAQKINEKIKTFFKKNTTTTSPTFFVQCVLYNRFYHICDFCPLCYCATALNFREAISNFREAISNCFFTFRSLTFLNCHL